jgi:predicted O-methyltransferase YrrM
MNKLEGLPTVHYISLEESVDRRNNLENWFQKYNITNYVPHLFKRYEEGDYELVGPMVHLLLEGSKGPITSHFLVLKEWYEKTEEPYTIVVEDDLSLETVQYWNFTWKDFYQNLPEDWNCIQLGTIREYSCNQYYFEKRKDSDWLAVAYLIKRDYVKFLLDRYYSSDIFTLDIKEFGCIPVIEQLLFLSPIGGVYSFPLFVEDCVNTTSSIVMGEHRINGQGYFHHESYNDVINWWKETGTTLTIEQVMKGKINHIYQDPQFGENWFSYPNLYKNIVKKFPSKSKFVEIGSWKGKSSAFMAVEIANSYKDIDFYCVDTWKGGPDHQDRDDLHNLYETFIENMKSLENYYIPMRMTSIESSQKFEDKSLDFVFIDASHEYEDVKNDIIAWLPKVKTGGIIAGHDYYVDSYDYFPGVKQAVGETLGKYELEFDQDCWICVVKGNEEILSELVNFSLDTENSEKNYALAKWYEEQGHTAPAHTYYLRSAERTNDKVLAYQALIRASFCYNRQGSRDGTEKVLLENALMLLPERPEAYYFLSLIYEKKTEWQNCYIFANLGLEKYKKPIDSIDLPEYQGEYLLIFQKAVSSWWWGKGDESRKLFSYLQKNYYSIMSETHKKLIDENMQKIDDDIFENEYKNACKTPSDINEHLPILYDLAKKCSHITEMGVRFGASTRAFLNANVTLRSYDIFMEESVSNLFKKAKEIGKDVEYIIEDVNNIEIEETDLLFLDTWHQYYQVKNELKLHANKVKKYIIFHDTYSYGLKGEPITGVEANQQQEYNQNLIGILPAIVEFMIDNPNWNFILHKINNNGLTVIERT